MYQVCFIFAPGNIDDEFIALDTEIGDMAKTMAGYIGQEGWVSKDQQTVNSVYYWESLETLKAFSHYTRHLEGKKQYKKWYKGYHVIISEVIKTYGDGYFDHITGNDRR